MPFQTVVWAIFYWFLMPGIILAVFWFSIAIVSRTRDPELKTSATAGFWAGMVILVIFALSQLNRVRPAFRLGELADLSPLLVGAGCLASFAFLWGVKHLMPTRLVGLITLVVAATSSVALYGYFFMEGLRGAVVSLAPGAVLGALLHLVFFPGSIRGIYGRAKKPEKT
ncbi:MAG: hypothetical protein K6T75_10265 [Acetobacteraceae bacterium]|nr:hypothetical protein [Acetobacteraceae bacterium]